MYLNLNVSRDEIDAGIQKINNLSFKTINGQEITGVGNLEVQGVGGTSNILVPSNNYEDMTLELTGHIYTAPADGWVCICKIALNVKEYLAIDWVTDEDVEFASPDVSFAAFSNHWLYCNTPIKKGQKYEVRYTASGETQYFRFVYADNSTGSSTDKSEITEAPSIIQTPAVSGFPSKYFEELELKESGAAYTAPADGWFLFRAHYPSTSTPDKSEVRMYGDNGMYSSNHTHLSRGISAMLPFNKGERMTLFVLGNIVQDDWYMFRFIYAKGSEPKE